MKKIKLPDLSKIDAAKDPILQFFTAIDKQAQVRRVGAQMDVTSVKVSEDDNEKLTGLVKKFALHKYPKKMFTDKCRKKAVSFHMFNYGPSIDKDLKPGEIIVDA